MLPLRQRAHRRAPRLKVTPVTPGTDDRQREQHGRACERAGGAGQSREHERHGSRRSTRRERCRCTDERVVRGRDCSDGFDERRPRSECDRCSQSGHAVEREHRGSRQQSGYGRRRQPVEQRGRERGSGRRRRRCRSRNGDCDGRPAVAVERQRVGTDREPRQQRSGDADEHRFGRRSGRADSWRHRSRRPTRRPTCPTRRTSTSRSANARLPARRRAPARPEPDLRSRPRSQARRPLPRRRALRRRRLRRPTRRT